jgi:hypothetical protein
MPTSYSSANQELSPAPQNIHFVLLILRILAARQGFRMWSRRFRLLAGPKGPCSQACGLPPCGAALPGCRRASARRSDSPAERSPYASR